MPQSSLVAWYQSANAGAQWISQINADTYAGEVLEGDVLVKAETGHGYSRTINYIEGTTASQYSFGHIISDNFTICSVTRYTGDTKGRILQGTRSNWFHGHRSSGAIGVSFYGGYQTPTMSSSDELDTTDWLIMCGSNGVELQLVDGIQPRTNRAVRSGGEGNQSLVINAPQSYLNPPQPSDWGVAEVITWDRVLTHEEMNGVMDYLTSIGTCNIGALKEQ